MSKSDDDEPLTAEDWRLLGLWLIATTPPSANPYEIEIMEWDERPE